jgi:hypothetical protein
MLSTEERTNNNFKFLYINLRQKCCDCLKRRILSGNEETQVYDWHKRFHAGHKTVGFCCTGTHLHIGCSWTRSTLLSIMWRPWSIRLILLSPFNYALFSWLERFLKEQSFSSAEKAVAKRQELRQRPRRMDSTQNGWFLLHGNTPAHRL